MEKNEQETTGQTSKIAKASAVQQSQLIAIWGSAGAREGCRVNAGQLKPFSRVGPPADIDSA